jgi:hypothetical protein
VAAKHRAYCDANRGRYREWQSRWYRANRERVLAEAQERYLADPEAARQASRESYQRNRETRLARDREWRLQNVELSRERSREGYRRRADRLGRARAEGRARLAERTGRGFLAVRTDKQAHRAKKLGVPGRFTAADIVRLWHRQRGECAICGKRIGKRPEEMGAYQIDHVTPLARPELRPTNRPHNLQLLCSGRGSCNSVKGSKTMAAFKLYRRRLAEVAR